MKRFFVGLCGVIVLCLLMTTGVALAAPAEPEGVPASEPAMSGPSAAPEPPIIAVVRVTGANNAELSWLHVVEANAYEVYRGTAPYFLPPAGGNRIRDIPAGAYGAGSIVKYVDDGVDRSAADGTLPAVQIIGDPATNYFWVVRSRNGSGQVSDEVSNRVGEFDFDLEAGS